VIHIASALSVLRTLPPERQPVLRRHARLLAEAATALESEEERRRAREAIAPLLT
jgi:hypothetical protein